MFEINYSFIFSPKDLFAISASVFPLFHIIATAHWDETEWWCDEAQNNEKDPLHLTVGFRVNRCCSAVASVAVSVGYSSF